MNMKILAVVACILLTLMMFAPVTREAFAVKSATMNVIQYRFFDSEDSQFAALLLPDSAGGIDIMDWPLAKSQYLTIYSDPAYTVASYAEAGEYELAFNSNFTNAARATAGRSMMNYTDFRQAMACILDKFNVIAGPKIQGFATRDDTEIPMPLMSGYVNPNVAYPNYPWEWVWGTTPTKALQILWDGGWYNHAYFGSFTNLVLNYTNGSPGDPSGASSLLVGGNTNTGVIYPIGVDPHGQLYGLDTYNDGILVPTAIPALNGYYRTGDGRKDMGEQFHAMLGHIGIRDTLHACATLSILRPPVMEQYIYDWCTLGYSMGAPPNWWYSSFTPIGIVSDGPNPYLVDDTNMTNWAYAAFTAPTQLAFMNDILYTQDILVQEAYIVSVYSPAAYCAYKTGMLGAINELGYGYTGFNQLLNWVMMNTKKNTTTTYTGDPTLTPESNIIYYGEYNPPDSLNPIFSNAVFDFGMMDNVFTYCLAVNPYNTMVVGSVANSAPLGGDLPWMAYDWKLEIIINPENASLPNWSNVTYWFRDDITWQDGAPFTVDDVNYTIYVNGLYADAWTHSGFVHMVNASNNYKPYMTKWNDYCASWLVDTPSWLNVYAPNYEIVPKHLYENIVPLNVTEAALGIDTHSLHGVWPGAQAVSGNFLNTAEARQYGITYANVSTLSPSETDGGKYTWVGTGPFVFRAGSAGTHEQYATVKGGGLTLDANPNFWLSITQGEIAFRYTWIDPTTGNPAQWNPSSLRPSNTFPAGGYYKIGLGDLTMLANSYGFVGTPPSEVPIAPAIRAWNPGADLAAPAGVVGLSDLVTLALNYGKTWGSNP
jgi:hypothetical protein